MARNLRVALLSGNPDVLFGRLQLIESQPDLEVVYTEGNGLVAFQKVPELVLDVLVVDHRLKGLDGVELTKLLNETYLEQHEEPPAVILTGAYFSNTLQIACIRAGAIDLVTQDSDPEALLASIRAAGDHVAEPQASELFALFESELLTVETNLDLQATYEDLPERSRQILSGFLADKTDEQLAKDLDTPKYRVRQQFSQMLSLFGCATRAQLCLALYEGGLTDG